MDMMIKHQSDKYIVYFAQSAANIKNTKLIRLQLQLQKYKHIPKQKYKNTHTKSTEIKGHNNIIDHR